MRQAFELVDRSRGAEPGRVQRRVRRRATSGSTRTNPYYQQAFPVPKRDIAKAKALLKEAGVTGRMSLDFMVPNTPETRAGRRGACSRWWPKTGFDLKIRVTEFATSLKQAEDGDFQLYLIGWIGPQRSRRQFL